MNMALFIDGKRPYLSESAARITDLCYRPSEACDLGLLRNSWLEAIIEQPVSGSHRALFVTIGYWQRTLSILDIRAQQNPPGPPKKK
jgi:hypothetical protein